jgi:coenzyme F420 hydrogenase subunit delta
MASLRAQEPSILPAFCLARILILGVGNVLFGDDGFGPTVAERLTNEYEVPEHVYVMDVGTGVRKLLFTLTLSERQPEEIVVVDAVDWGKTIGRVSEIPVEALPVTKLDDFSLHHAPTSNLLNQLQEQRGVKVTVVACDVGVIPQMINPGLSAATEKAVEEACHRIAGKHNIRLKMGAPSGTYATGGLVNGE